MSQIDDVEAISSFMNSQHADNPKSADILSLFKSWYQNASWYDKNFSSDFFDEARTRRNQFNLANASSPAAVAQVQKVMTEGLTSEQLQGKPKPKIDPKTGAVGTQVHSPTVPGIAPGLTRNLKKGLNGDDVKQWQSFLGLTPPTGYFDALTDTKTRDWQKAQNLKVDGVVGKNTWTQAFGAQAVVAPSLPKPANETPAAAKNTPVTSTPPVSPHIDAEASLIPGVDLKNIPFWAKIAGAIGLTAGAGALAFHQHKSLKRT